MSCMLVITLIDGAEISLRSAQDGSPTDVARNLATRLKPDTCLWGAAGEFRDAAAAVVIPAARVDHIMVMQTPTAGDLQDSAVAESFASSDSAAQVPTDETTGPVSTG